MNAPTKNYEAVMFLVRAWRHLRNRDVDHDTLEARGVINELAGEIASGLAGAE
jgi:hypothetical protein